MSLNQSRSDNNDSHFRKTGAAARSGATSGAQQRTFTGGSGRGAAAPNLSTNRSFKKKQCSRWTVKASCAAGGAHVVQNGGHVQSTLHGVSKISAQSTITNPALASASTQTSSRPLPKVPPSNSTLLSTPEKGDGLKGFSLQFGSINPGFMNGMQVSPRTSSAPPNLDEQKRDQAWVYSPRAIPSIPLPSAQKQEAPKEDSSQRTVVQETHTELKAKRDVQVASVSSPAQPQKPSVLPRAQGSGQPIGGILSGPMHSSGFQGMQRNYSDADFNKGLMPAPETPLQVMHKAERKYEVWKISNEAKQRKLKGILNKLNPQNFEKLFQQFKEVHIDNVVTLVGVVSQIFDKALMEPTLCEMYANFCSHLAQELPDLSVDNEKITFRRLLLNKSQEEFERGEREEEEANKADDEGEIKQSEREREEKRLKVRRRMLGNIRLIGELYKKMMLTERIMHECIKKLLGDYQSPDEGNIEALCTLMSTIGEMIDHPRAKKHMDAYFDIVRQLSDNMNLSSRVRFMLRDSIDLRKNKWQQRKVEGPKKIDEVHRDAVQERLGQSARLSRGPSMNSAMRRGQPVEFNPRGPMLSSPVGQGGTFRGTSPQVCGYVIQDARTDERSAFESRTLSVPLLQRSGNDQSITLGPQGGLARGMAFRGQPSVSSSPFLDTSPSYGDPRRAIGGTNAYSTASDRVAYSSREDHFARHSPERLGGPGAFDQSNSQEYNANIDQNADGSGPTTPSVGRAGGSPAQNLSSETAWPEERLREKSIAAIKEYYSAKDEKEVALYIKELNAPSFYPKVVSIWVSDSFERKDMEIDSLAKLLVNLTQPQEGLFSPAQLIEGFQYVLSDLEDTVNDAPKAPEFLGRIFGKMIVENLLTLKEVGRLIHEGGEEPGSLVGVGLAADVLDSIFEMIKLEISPF